MEKPMPILVLVRGLPGSGKSFIVDKLRNKLDEDKIVVLDPDASDYKSESYIKLTKKLSAEGVNEKFYPYRFLRAQAYEGIESGKIIFWNQAFTNLDGFQKTVVNLTSYAEGVGVDLKILVVEVDINPDVALKRIASRVAEGGHGVPEERFAQFAKDYKSFAPEGYKIVEIDGEADTNESCEKIINAINKLSV